MPVWSRRGEGRDCQPDLRPAREEEAGAQCRRLAEVRRGQGEVHDARPDEERSHETAEEFVREVLADALKNAAEALARKMSEASEQNKLLNRVAEIFGRLRGILRL